MPCVSVELLRSSLSMNRTEVRSQLIHFEFALFFHLCTLSSLLSHFFFEQEFFFKVRGSLELDNHAGVCAVLLTRADYIIDYYPTCQ